MGRWLCMERSRDRVGFVMILPGLDAIEDGFRLQYLLMALFSDGSWSNSTDSLQLILYHDQSNVSIMHTPLFSA